MILATVDDLLFASHICFFGIYTSFSYVPNCSVTISIFQLKNLAFGKVPGNPGGKGQHHKNVSGDGGDERKAWDSWKEHDKEVLYSILVCCVNSLFYGFSHQSYMSFLE